MNDIYKGESMHKEKITKAFGNLASLYNDSSIFEIFVDGPNQVRVEKNGKITLENGLITSVQEIQNIIDALFQLVGRKFPSNGWGDISLADGTRVLAMSNALSINGPIFNVRKLPQQSLNWDGLLKHKVINQSGKDLLEDIMKNGKNVVVCGGLNSGKTTLTNNIVSLIPNTQRIVCLEKVPQLILLNSWTVRLQTAENKKDGMLDLLNAASLMRPDYLVINEIVREEIPQMLDMMREGYSTLSCMHADSTTDVLRRIELKYLSTEVAHTLEQARELIASAIDYVVCIKRTDKGRRVTEIIEVAGFENEKYILTPTYRWDGE